MIVVDASVLTNALTDDGPVGSRSREDLGDDPRWSAPEHLLVEVFSAVRGRCAGGKLSERRAREALGAVASANVELVSTRPLLARMWELRSHVTGYDAACVALAETV